MHEINIYFWYSETFSSSICCLQETHFKFKDTCILKVNEWRKIYHANTNQKKVRIAKLISYRLQFKVKKGIRNKEGIT